jgi:hypothetical protein
MKQYEQGGPQPEQWAINTLYDAPGVLAPPDVDRSGRVAGAVPGYVSLLQRRQQLYSALGPRSQRQVAAAMQSLEVPFDLVKTS